MNLVCFTEEKSAKEMLQIVLPKILPNNCCLSQIIPFEGKQDLEKNIALKIKNYNIPDTKFLIMRDKDSEDCKKVKAELLSKIKNSGKAHVSLVRIACHELESFYLGDLQAVKKGLNLDNIPNQTKNKFRNPDDLANAKQELIKNTNKLYQPVSGSKAISSHLKLDGSNKSISFGFLLSGIRQLCDT